MTPESVEPKHFRAFRQASVVWQIWAVCLFGTHLLCGLGSMALAVLVTAGLPMSQDSRKIESAVAAMLTGVLTFLNPKSEGRKYLKAFRNLRDALNHPERTYEGVKRAHDASTVLLENESGSSFPNKMS